MKLSKQATSGQEKRLFYSLVGATTGILSFVILKILPFIILFFILVSPVFSKEPAKKSFKFKEEPTRIIIPKARISLPVFTAKVALNTWEVRTDGASFGDGSALPGTDGNTVIFSHALPGLFISLPEVKKGDLIHVFTKQDWIVYKVTETRTVDPEDTKVIFSHGHHELTLYTCVENDEKRFVVKAKPIN